SRIGSFSLLDDRTVLAFLLKKVRVNYKRFGESAHGQGVFLVAEIGVTEVAVNGGQVRVVLNGFLVLRNGFSVMLFLVFDGAEIVDGAGVSLIEVYRFFVVALGSIQVAQLLISDSYFVQELRILRLRLDDLAASIDRRGVLLARHQDVALEFSHLARRHR